jgi:multimeric flavodoxin WrbA
MNLLAVLGSPRKGKGTDILLRKVIEGARAVAPDLSVEKIDLIDRDIRHCRNCLACRDSEEPGPVTRCSIRDDMDDIVPALLRADLLVFGTPVHMGYATALVMGFLERIVWRFAKPTKSYLTIHGCPEPRDTKRRKAAILVTSGIITPFYRRFCDEATPLIRGTIADSLGAKTVGSVYAGGLERRGVEHYFARAEKLGRKLASWRRDTD